MKRAGMDFSIDQLFRLQEADIEPELAAHMVSARRPDWTTDDIVEMLAQGACPVLVSKLNELGFGELSPRDAVQLSEYDVDLDYLERFRGMPMTWLTAQDLIAFPVSLTVEVRDDDGPVMRARVTFDIHRTN